MKKECMYCIVVMGGKWIGLVGWLGLEGESRSSDRLGLVSILLVGVVYYILWCRIRSYSIDYKIGLEDVGRKKGGSVEFESFRELVIGSDWDVVGLWFRVLEIVIWGFWVEGSCGMSGLRRSKVWGKRFCFFCLVMWVV